MENVSVQTVASFYEVVRAELNLQAVQDLLEVSTLRFDRASVRESYGTGNSLEVLNAEVARNSDQVTVFQAEQNLAESYRALNLVMGRPIDAPVQVDQLVTMQESLDLASLKQAMETANRQLDAADMDQQL